MEDLFVKAATLIAVALATFSSFPGTAQQDTAAQAASITTSQNSTQPNSNEAPMNSATAQLKPVTGELTSKLDSKSAKQGDSVVVKTDESLTISPGTEIPKGSKLLGRITNVQPRGDGKENSQIAIQFDRAELKDGKTLPIESVIKSVAPSGSAESMNASGGMGVSPASQVMGTAQGTNPTAGSMNQGVMNQGTMNQGTINQGAINQGAMTTSRPGVPSAMPQQGANQSTNGNASAPGTIVSQNGNVAIRTTAIPGVLLANDIHGLPFTNASGMLLGARRNIHLDSGTRFVLAVAMAPQGSGSGMNR
jgi:hypothetical protein